MTTYRFGYAPWSVPLVLPLGLVPPLAGIDLDGRRFRLRFGLWFTLEARLEQIADVAIDLDEEHPTIPAKVAKGNGRRALTVRTGPGPLVRVTFVEPAEGRYLPIPKLPKVPMLRINLTDRYDEIAFNAADPSAVASAIRLGQGEPGRATGRAGSRARPSGRGGAGSASPRGARPA